MKFSLTVILTIALSMPLLAAPPSAPSGISARTTSAGYVEINWSRATDSDGTIAAYELIKNQQAIPVGNVTRYIDNDVRSGVSYTYRVAAIDNTNERSVSNSSVTVSISNSGSTISTGTQQASGSQQDGGQRNPTPQQTGSQTTTQVTSTSPQDISTGALTSCIDTDGDGWGWDGYESCIVDAITTALCGDQASGSWIADNGLCSDNSIGVTAATHICVDFDGDGWGWNGTDSCRIDSISNTTSCIDVDGDGWGWNGSESCVVELDNIQHVVDCLDADGIGWGWGWTGTDSCIP